jgi:hypothetical protein
MDKLQQLVRDYGYSDVLEMCEDIITDSVSPGICMVDGCDYSTDVEPDQARGWCEVCEATTVMSGLMLAGLI